MSRRVLSGIVLLALLAAGAAIWSCSSGEPKPAAQQAPPAASPATEQSPGDTVQKFFSLLNQRRFAEAQSLYSAEALKIIDDPAVMGMGRFEQWAQGETKMGTVKDVSIQDTQTAGDTATVQFEVSYTDGSKAAKKVDMKREGGGWKMGMIG